MFISGECNFSGRMLKSLRIKSGVPFSGNAAEKGFHVIVEVANETWRTVDHNNVELDRKVESASVKFKCRSG